ncbi:hypothetical protein Godav_014413 [Gossypium davidsonii]|uniref:Mediator of RNA polymerase II transcription subunit 29 n=2 Tax=Gossypium TaxID=3633 RepID=A0A7J8RKN4_GOSDV|nr:hypothetical protein [Gossypium davidsonii]MBA0649295.1 hypothetical protein [Gossypium klotzschianum]
MEKVVDCLENAYQEFVDAAAAVLETKASFDCERTAATDAALESFKKKWETFKAACDQAQELVDSVKQRITANTTFPVNEDMIDIFDHSIVDFDD